MSKTKDFLKDIGSLSIWNISSSLINILIFYSTTNLLGPTEYGKYSLVLAIVATFTLSLYASVNESLQRFSAITRDKKLIELSINIQSKLGLIAFFGFTILSIFASDIYNKPISFILFIISLSFLFTPTIEVVRNFSIGRKKVRNFVSLSFFNQLFFLLLILILYLFNLRIAMAASFIYLIVSIFSFIHAKRILKKEKFISDGKYNKKEIIRYIKYGFLFGFFKNLYLQTPLIIGSRFVDVTNIAYYTFSISIANASILAFVSSIHLMNVPYLTEFYKKRQKNKIIKYFNANIKFGLIITIISSVLLYTFLRFTMKYLFPKYIGTLQILPYILIGYILLNFITPIIFLKAKGEIYIITKAAIMSAIFSFISSLLLSKFLGLKGMILSLIFNIIFFSLVLLYYAYTKLGLKFTIIPNKEEIKIFVIYTKKIILKILSVLNKLS